MTIVSSKDLYGKVMSLWGKGGLPKGYGTGWDEVDQFLSIPLGNLVVLTGIPSMGKSEWMDALMVNLSRKHKFRWCIFSPENHPMELHAVKIMEKYMGIPFNPGPTKPMVLEDVEKGMRWMEKHFEFMDMPDEELTPISIINQGTEWASAIGEEIPLGMVIDPWNEMDHRRPAGLTESEYISQTLTYFRRFARQQNVFLVLVAHPTKLMKNSKNSYDCPTPYDISGAAHWRNKADICIAIHRNMSEAPDVTEVHVQKVRFKHVGKVGMGLLRWDRVTGRYRDENIGYERMRG
jgi:twinkle protein